MDIDKVWVEENIDHIMNTFLGSHPQFELKDKSSQSAKRRHKKNMLENMDTMMYRPIYQLARFTKKTAIDEIETINHGNYGNFKLYKDKSCKLEIENRELKKRIKQLEKI
jgi:hypothetical protein